MSTTDFQRLEAGIRQAHAQGDDETVRVLGAELRRLQKMPTPKKALPERSLVGATIEAVPNIPSSAAEFATGFYKAVTHPLQTAGTLLDIAAGGLQAGAKKALPKDVYDFIEGLDADPKAAQRAMQTARQFGGQMAARYGSYDAIKNTLATDPVGFAADFSTLLSGGAGIAGRAGKAAAAAKLEKWAQRTNPVNALRPVGRAAVKIAERAPLKIANVMSPKSAAYMEAAEGRAPELIAQLRAPSMIVPGSALTATEVAAPLNLAKFAAMGEEAKKALPSEYFTRGAEQEAARLAAIQSVGGTADNLSALQKGRKLTAQQNYGAIEKNIVEVDDTFRALTQRPSMDKAMKRAADISAEQGVPFQIGRDIRPGSMAGMATSGSPAQYTVQSLHNLKTAMDDIIKDPATFGIGANEARLMGRTRDQLVKWIESKEPGYKGARETFAKQSRRINQAEVGQFLEGKLTSALPQGTERANVFGAAVKEAPATIKRALTGESRYQQLTDLLEPHQVKIINAVRDDLARKATVKVQAQKGAAATPRLRQLASASNVRAPNLLNRVTAVANDIIRRLEGKIDRKIAIEIATEMLDPKAAANAVEKAAAREYMAQLAGRGAGAATKTAGKALRSGAAKVGAQTQNVMTQAENQNAMNRVYEGAWAWDPNTQTAIWEPN